MLASIEVSVVDGRGIGGVRMNNVSVGEYVAWRILGSVCERIRALIVNL